MLFPDYTSSLIRHGKDRDVYQFLSRNERENSKIFRADVALFEGLYTQSRTYQTPHYTIPKTIHQIWLGGGKIPADCKRWMATWRKLKGIEYKLWTNDDIKDFPLTNKDLFDHCNNLGAQSDILRYEILYRLGGLYVDVDIECLSPDFFMHAIDTYDFFTGTEPLNQALDLWVGNSIIGTKPGHFILKRAVDHLPKTCPANMRSPVFVTGPGYFIKQMKIALLENLQMLGRLVVFPTGFFNPISLNEAWLLDKKSDPLRYPETVSVHYFKKSWDKALKITKQKKHAQKKLWPSFFSALQRHGKDQKSYAYLMDPTQPSAKRYQKWFKELRKRYDRLKNNPLPIKKIPKIIHQIDATPNEDDRDRYMVMWMGINGFEYKLWSQRQLEIDFPNTNLIFNDIISQEILQFEVLYRHGGIFVDSHLLCLDEVFFQWIVERCDLFSGMIPLAESSQLTISSALIGVRPEHPVIKRCLERFKKERLIRDCARIFTEELLDYLKNENPSDLEVVFPPTYFNPLTSQEAKIDVLLNDETVVVRDLLSKIKKRILN